MSDFTEELQFTPDLWKIVLGAGNEDEANNKSFHFGAWRDQAKTWKQECTWGVLGVVMRLT